MCRRTGTLQVVSVDRRTPGNTFYCRFSVGDPLGLDEMTIYATPSAGASVTAIDVLG